MFEVFDFFWEVIFFRREGNDFDIDGWFRVIVFFKGFDESWCIERGSDYGGFDMVGSK